VIGYTAAFTAILFARRRHRLRFASAFAYAPFKAMVTRISKWSIYPGFLPDHTQNWITGSLCHAQHICKISDRSDRSYFSDTQTDKQTNSGKNITSLAELTTSDHHLSANI